MAKYYTSAVGTSVILANQASNYSINAVINLLCIILSMCTLYLNIVTLLFEKPLYQHLALASIKPSTERLGYIQVLSQY